MNIHLTRSLSPWPPVGDVTIHEQGPRHGADTCDNCWKIKLWWFSKTKIFVVCCWGSSRKESAWASQAPLWPYRKREKDCQWTLREKINMQFCYRKPLICPCTASFLWHYQCQICFSLCKKGYMVRNDVWECVSLTVTVSDMAVLFKKYWQKQTKQEKNYY